MFRMFLHLSAIVLIHFVGMSTSKTAVFLLITLARKMTKDPLNCKWEEFKTKTEVIVMTCDGCKPRAVIASFDMDGTIITTKSGNTFSKNLDDWKLWAPEVNRKKGFPIKISLSKTFLIFQVKTTLQKLHYEDGYKIIFFTNQGGIETGKVKKDDFRRKITAIVKELDVPIQLFAATSKYASNFIN